MKISAQSLGKKLYACLEDQGCSAAIYSDKAMLVINAEKLVTGIDLEHCDGIVLYGDIDEFNIIFVELKCHHKFPQGDEQDRLLRKLERQAVGGLQLFKRYFSDLDRMPCKKRLYLIVIPPDKMSTLGALIRTNKKKILSSDVRASFNIVRIIPSGSVLDIINTGILLHDRDDKN